MMARNISTIPKAPIARILMKSGAKRVSQSAIDAFTDVITEITEDLARKSSEIAKHSGRKTVLEGDVRLAVK